MPESDSSPADRSIAACGRWASTLIPRNEWMYLLQAATGLSKATIYAFAERSVDPIAFDAFVKWVSRRRLGEPAAYLTGVREFFSRSFVVSPDVLIPRPETELLVDIALHLLAQHPQKRVLDLGTGSGCIAITLALEAQGAAVTATDVSASALTIARHNAQALIPEGNAITFLEGSWYEALRLSSLPFNVIVANPPYINASDQHLHQGDLRFEPQLALTDFADGLHALQMIVSGASAYLVQNGWLVIEHGFMQHLSVTSFLHVAGFVKLETVNDLAGHPRVTYGQRP